MGEAAQDAAEAIGRLLRENKQTVAVAESLTSGKLASRLGAAPEASNWFAGGVVAYAAHVKFEVLGVEPGPVVSEQCARQMARGEDVAEYQFEGDPASVLEQSAAAALSMLLATIEPHSP